MEWAEQRTRIKQMCDNWHIVRLMAEKNSIGSPNIEALYQMKVYAVPFETTNESKSAIMSNMHEMLHTGWKLLNTPVQRHEFNTFVSTQLPSGAWRLAADGAGHDDTVMACAICLWQIKSVWWMSNAS
jgi:hypothetical protein